MGEDKGVLFYFEAMEDGMRSKFALSHVAKFASNMGGCFDVFLFSLFFSPFTHPPVGFQEHSGSRLASCVPLIIKLPSNIKQ